MATVEVGAPRFAGSLLSKPCAMGHRPAFQHCAAAWQPRHPPRRPAHHATHTQAALEAPFPDRPNEGSLRFNVELLPMAAPHWEGGRPGEEATELARLVERGLRESRAVDTEALVVLAGRRVWHVRVDIFVQARADMIFLVF